MIPITLYTFYKRENSTKRPDGSVTQKIHNAVFKMPTSLQRPEITFDFGLKGNPTFYNYAFIPALGNRYYFIRDWTVSEGHLWTAHMEVDTLASWKVSIGNSTQYVLRSSYTSDGHICDKLYPTKQGVTLKQASATANPFKKNIKDGRYVCGIINADKDGVGAVHYYAFTQEQFNALTSYLMDDVSWMSITDIGEELQKALLNPMQYITSCCWIPRGELTGVTAVTSIRFGYWTINVACSRIIGTPIQTMTGTITLPKHPQVSRGVYLNGAPYSDYMLTFPGFGEIHLDANIFVDVSAIWFQVYLDTVSGLGKLVILDANPTSTSANIVQVIRSQIGVPIQMAQMASQFFTGLGNVVSTTAGTAVSAAAGNVAGVISGAVGMIGSAVEASIPKMTSQGANGSFAEFQLDPTVYATFYPIVDEDNADRGRPLCKMRVLSSLPGYQVIADPDVAIGGTSDENRQIKSYLAGGYFYE